MKERIVEFLASEKISPAEFADKIGVQRSSMSHILNGRNYPSATFLQKMLQVYPSLNPRWLMIGDGSMSTVHHAKGDFPDSPFTIQSDSLPFATNASVGAAIPNDSLKGKPVMITETDQAVNTISPVIQSKSAISAPSTQEDKTTFDSHEKPEEKDDGNKKPEKSALLHDILTDEREIEQILFFYKDKTFTVYRPS